MKRIDLNDYLEADLYRYSGAKGSCYFLKALFPSIPGYRYTYLLRYASVFPKHTVRGFICRVLLTHYGYKYGFQIPPNTKIGKGLYIGHWGAVVINGLTELGDNCTLAHTLTIGQTNRGKKVGCPSIGNKVWVGAGAVLVGKIIIGNNVLIAPNAYVNFDVPDNSIVSGNPATIKPHADATEGYINYVLSESEGTSL